MPAKQLLQSGNFNSNMSNTFYQRTLASERSSDLYRHQHMTHNSDLIEQIGGEFIVDTEQLESMINPAPQPVYPLTQNSTSS